MHTPVGKGQGRMRFVVVAVTPRLHPTPSPTTGTKCCIHKSLLHLTICLSIHLCIIINLSISSISLSSYQSVSLSLCRFVRYGS